MFAYGQQQQQLRKEKQHIKEKTKQEESTPLGVTTGASAQRGSPGTAYLHNSIWIATAAQQSSKAAETALVAAVAQASASARIAAAAAIADMLLLVITKAQ